jgi:glycosyltransferase involved in cell wall biosynthesis
MIVRGEARGLGHLTREVWRHLKPDRALVVDMGEWARGFPRHDDWYPNAWHVTFNGSDPAGAFDLGTMHKFADGLDALYTAETAYDWRFPPIAREHGCRTILHSMPELHAPHLTELVDRVWLPTPWRAEHHPDAPLVPIPVALDRWPTVTAADPEDGPLRVLHVAGHAAAMDRNGTRLFAEAIRWCTEPMHITVRSQDPAVPAPQPFGPVTVEVVTETAGEYWEAYSGHHVLVMPRRYGGLCLPAQEAMAAGLALVMPNVSPNGWWPALLVEGGRGPQFQAPCGPLDTFAADPRHLAHVLDRLARDRGNLSAQQVAARLWAIGSSWETLLPYWQEMLAE